MGKFTGSVTKVGNRLMIEVPRPLAKALANTTVLVDVRPVHPIKHTVNGRMQRNREILQRSREGLSNDELAEVYGLRPERIKVIIDETAHLEEQNSVGLYLSVRTMNVIRSAFGLYEPTMDSFKAYVKSTPNWRERIRSTKGGGQANIQEIEAFCREHKIPC